MRRVDINAAELSSWVRRNLAPALTHATRKGSVGGRIGVLGGCREYTGAPYFAAIAAHRVGADIVHIFTTECAAPIIKNYSPDLIVHADISEDDGEQLGGGGKEWQSEWIARMDALVVGPGLGRGSAAQHAARGAILHARIHSVPVVIDADGLFVVQQDISLVKGNENVILTPNHNEYRRLLSATGISVGQDERQLGEELGVGAVVCKGQPDIITDGRGNVVECGVAGCPRRCGGQGDILSGALSVYAKWMKQYSERPGKEDTVAPPMVAASFAACLLTRETAQAAYNARRRSLIASDFLEFIGDTSHQLFDTADSL